MLHFDLQSIKADTRSSLLLYASLFGKEANIWTNSDLAPLKSEWNLDNVSSIRFLA